MAESLLQTQKWSSAVKAYNKIADVLLETLQDMKHIDDEILEAYRQARENLTIAHAEAIWTAYQRTDCDPKQVDPCQAGLAAELEGGR